ATAVCSDNDDEFEVLDLLTRLAERSLVIVQRSGTSVRYRFLESVWRFALDQLKGHPGRVSAQERYVKTYIEFTSKAELRLQGSNIQETLAELGAEEENILSAIGLCAGMPDGVPRGFQIATAICRMWGLRGRAAVGRRVLEEVVARDTTRTPTRE